MLFLPVDSSYEAADAILPATTASLWFDGSDLSQYYLGHDMGASRGQAVTGSIRLKDRSGNLAAIVSRFRQSLENYRAHNMTADKTISLTVTQGGVSTEYPTLLPGSPSWDNEGTLTWPVTDLSPLINKDNQNADDILWDEGDDESVNDIIATLAALAGVAISNRSADWDVRTWRMAGENVLSKIDDLCRATQSYRKWEGSTLYLEALNETKPSRWHAVDRFHIPSLTPREDADGIRTRFKAFRLAPQPQRLTEPVQGNGVGRVVEITFPPTNGVRIITNARHGTIEDGVFYDEDEEPIVGWVPGPMTECVGQVAVRWLGTYVPSFGDVEYQPWWIVYAEGGSYNANEVEGFDFSAIAGTAEAIFGSRPDFSNLETELIRDPETFDSLLDAIVLEVDWSARTFGMTTPYLAPAREGDFLTVTHFRSGLSAEKMLVHGWNHSFSWENGWNNTYDLRAKL